MIVMGLANYETTHTRQNFSTTHNTSKNYRGDSGTSNLEVIEKWCNDLGTMMREYKEGDWMFVRHHTDHNYIEYLVSYNFALFDARGTMMCLDRTKVSLKVTEWIRLGFVP